MCWPGLFDWNPLALAYVYLVAAPLVVGVAVGYRLPWFVGPVWMVVTAFGPAPIMLGAPDSPIRVEDYIISLVMALGWMVIGWALGRLARRGIRLAGRQGYASALGAAAFAVCAYGLAVEAALFEWDPVLLLVYGGGIVVTVLTMMTIVGRYQIGDAFKSGLGFAAVFVAGYGAIVAALHFLLELHPSRLLWWAPEIEAPLYYHPLFAALLGAVAASVIVLRGKGHTAIPRRVLRRLATLEGRRVAVNDQGAPEPATAIRQALTSHGIEVVDADPELTVDIGPGRKHAVSYRIRLDPRRTFETDEVPPGWAERAVLTAVEEAFRGLEPK